MLEGERDSRGGGGGGPGEGRVDRGKGVRRGCGEERERGNQEDS